MLTAPKEEEEEEREICDLLPVCVVVVKPTML
jgi:hypothetical protein